MPLFFSIKVKMERTCIFDILKLLEINLLHVDLKSYFKNNFKRNFANFKHRNLILSTMQKENL